MPCREENTICGLIYAHSNAPVNDWIFEQYEKQKTRGHDGFGLFNGVHLVKAAEENRIVNWLAKEKNKSNLILFHHRWPTSTINVRKAAHPLTTKDYFGDTEYIMVHNGIISNDEELFTKHAEAGIEYFSLLDDLTFNDSEGLLWELALTLEGKQQKIEARGAMAFICLKLVKGKLDKLYFGRNTNPLYLEQSEDGMFLSSEFNTHTAGEIIDIGQLYTYDYACQTMTEQPFAMPSYAVEPYGYGGYGRPAWDREDDPYWNGGGSHDPTFRKPKHHQYTVPIRVEPKTETEAETGTDEVGTAVEAKREQTAVVQVGEVIGKRLRKLNERQRIEHIVTGYLLGHDFNFSEAWQEMGNDYYILEATLDEETDVTDLHVLQKAIFKLEGDPLWIDATSIDTKREALCRTALQRRLAV